MGHTVETARKQYTVAFRQEGLEFAAEVAGGVAEFGEEVCGARGNQGVFAF